MSDGHMILVPIANGQALALEPNAFNDALRRGSEMLASTQPKREVLPEITDAKGMEAITKISAGWFEEAARKERIPHLKFGKFVRFNVLDVLESAALREKTTKTARITRGYGIPRSVVTY